MAQSTVPYALFCAELRLSEHERHRCLHESPDYARLWTRSAAIRRRRRRNRHHGEDEVQDGPLPGRAKIKVRAQRVKQGRYSPRYLRIDVVLVYKLPYLYYVHTKQLPKGVFLAQEAVKRSDNVEKHFYVSILRLISRLQKPKPT